jgi:hypothetical protein
MRFEGPIPDTLGIEEPRPAAVHEVEDSFLDGDDVAVDPKLTLPPRCVCTGGAASPDCGSCVVRQRKLGSLARRHDVPQEAVRDLLMEDFGHCTTCNEVKPLRGSFPTGESPKPNGMQHITCEDCSLESRG